MNEPGIQKNHRKSFLKIAFEYIAQSNPQITHYVSLIT